MNPNQLLQWLTIKPIDAFIMRISRLFLETDPYSILGQIHNTFHGQALTTTDEAWFDEINILQEALLPWANEEADIIFEYDIPRLGKRIDVVLLLRGIIFCLEFKVGQKDALQADVNKLWIMPLT